MCYIIYGLTFTIVAGVIFAVLYTLNHALVFLQLSQLVKQLQQQGRVIKHNSSLIH